MVVTFKYPTVDVKYEGEEKMSRNPVLYKSLVVGVIVLFIGVGIQTAIAFETEESNDRGFILCYTRVGLSKYKFYFPATLTIVKCEDLDTGKIRIGITRFTGFHIFKYLPMGHNYKISAYPLNTWDDDIIINNLGIVDIAIISYTFNWD